MRKKELISIIREEIHEILQERYNKDKKEKIIKEIKKVAPHFKKKYGDKWKNVMYETVIKVAKLNEKEMSKAEIKKREQIADELMKEKSKFEKKYGDDWEKVLWSTATKIAMGDKEHAS